MGFRAHSIFSPNMVVKCSLLYGNKSLAAGRWPFVIPLSYCEENSLTICATEVVEWKRSCVQNTLEIEGNLSGVDHIPRFLSD